eukprot:TRINITY_DN6926_c0_g1_i1.p1 TRINITY_DN6926_c0_g1~~TRINITY_DN6926_c0_g1_i1.p1  ORF type:complete len:217 (+),score=31.60 TRINITY_DN6926_c0_g1_i1:187-837(+)
MLHRLWRSPLHDLDQPLFKCFKTVAIKRDDVLFLEGNKARKLFFLANLSNLKPLLDFQKQAREMNIYNSFDRQPPGTELTQQFAPELVDEYCRAFKQPVVASFGGNQSNAMLALSQLCREKQWPFVYLSPTVELQAAHSNRAAAVNTHFIASSSDAESQAVLSGVQGRSNAVIIPYVEVRDMRLCIVVHRVSDTQTTNTWQFSRPTLALRLWALCP